MSREQQGKNRKSILFFMGVWDVGGVRTKASEEALRRIPIERHVSYLINDWCLPFRTTLFLRRACRSLGGCLIASTRNPLLRTASRAVSSLNLFLGYFFCDRYVLPSESFKPIFRRVADQWQPLLADL